MTCRLRWWSKSKPDVEFQYGGRLGEFHGMSFYSYVSHCRVLPLAEFTVMIPEPHATLQGVIIPSAVLKIVFRYILFFNAVWALTSGGFRIVSDTLVIMYSMLDFRQVMSSWAPMLVFVIIDHYDQISSIVAFYFWLAYVSNKSIEIICDYVMLCYTDLSCSSIYFLVHFFRLNFPFDFVYCRLIWQPASFRLHVSYRIVS